MTTAGSPGATPLPSPVFTTRKLPPEAPKPMKLHRPSPAMVVALIALVMAMTGSAVAAVNFATNAGAVDGKSAVRAGVTRSFAAGRLVATAADGPNKGRIPSKFLDLSPTVRGT